MQVRVIEAGSAVYEHEWRTVSGANYFVIELAARAVEYLAFFVK
jgi:hypothetical protein